MSRKRYISGSVFPCLEDTSRACSMEQSVV